MTIRYLNTKINGTTETLDSVDSSDYPTTKAMRQAQSDLVMNYRVAGGNHCSFGSPYWSSRKAGK